jgi:hypothetical protein
MAGLPSAPEMARAPRWLRLVPIPDLHRTLKVGRRDDSFGLTAEMAVSGRADISRPKRCVVVGAASEKRLFSRRGLLRRIRRLCQPVPRARNFDGTDQTHRVEKTIAQRLRRGALLCLFRFGAEAADALEMLEEWERRIEVKIGAGGLSHKIPLA